MTGSTPSDILRANLPEEVVLLEIRPAQTGEHSIINAKTANGNQAFIPIKNIHLLDIDYLLWLTDEIKRQLGLR